MKYLADALTFFRFVLSISYLVACIKGTMPFAMIMAISAALTDAFDGIAARKWPYTAEENSRYWWRKNPHFVDNIADTTMILLFAVGLLFVDFRVWIIVLVSIGLIAVLWQIAIHKLPGRNKIIDGGFAWLYVGFVALTVVAVTIYATPKIWPILIAAYLAATAPLAYIKRDRIKQGFL